MTDKEYIEKLERLIAEFCDGNIRGPNDLYWATGLSIEKCREQWAMIETIMKKVYP